MHGSIDAWIKRERGQHTENQVRNRLEEHNIDSVRSAPLSLSLFSSILVHFLPRSLFYCPATASLRITSDPSSVNRQLDDNRLSLSLKSNGPTDTAILSNREIVYRPDNRRDASNCGGLLFSSTRSRVCHFFSFCVSRDLQHSAASGLINSPRLYFFLFFWPGVATRGCVVTVGPFVLRLSSASVYLSTSLNIQSALYTFALNSAWHPFPSALPLARSLRITDLYNMPIVYIIHERNSSRSVFH